VDLWKKFGGILFPYLARVFSAIGRSASAPPGFLFGVVVAIFKKGDPTDPANYRPITLLNSDYRLLARVLATRIAPALASVVGPEQTAFIPGRLIGDNITLLQLLPDVLRSNAACAAAAAGAAAAAVPAHVPPAWAASGAPGATRAVVAFLDFRKAFDTISRPFLYASMAEVLGPDSGMLSWARTLLGPTAASAVVNGFESRPSPTAAGVRQGCPLSPALYLFVAMALGAWLRAQPEDTVGVDLGPDAGGRLCGTQFADDTEAVLPGLEEADVARFLAALRTFERASGQGLNVPKCELLPVGDWAGAQVPDSVCGLRVVRMAAALGMRFSNQPGEADAAVDWPARLEGVESCYSRLAKLPLSTFGRGFAASG
jgi:hypothetical protein